MAGIPLDEAELLAIFLESFLYGESPVHLCNTFGLR